MTPPRRALALLTTTTFAVGTLLLGAPSASALPNNFDIPVGAPVNISIAGTNATFTQTTPVTIVEAASLDVALGETFDIVQPDPDMLMVIRNMGGSPVQWNGAITADANLLVISTAGINVNGTVSAGGDLVLSSGDTTNAGAQLGFVPLSPTAASGAISIGTAGELDAGGNLGLAGNDITVAGSVYAAGPSNSLISDDDIDYARNDTGGGGLVSNGAGFAGGLVQTTTTADVRAVGVVFVRATAPSTASLDGNLAGDGNGMLIGAGVPGAVGVFGTSTSNDVQFDAYANRSGPAGGELGAHMFGGDSTPFTSGEVFQFVSYGAVAPSASVALVPSVTVFEELTTGFLLQCSTLEEPEDSASATVPTYVDFTVLETVYDGAVIIAGSQPLANQAPIVVPELGTITVNEQVRTVVGGWEIITATALHIVTPTEDIRLGVVECAQPAAAQLAATGVDRADAQLGFAGAVMLALTGVVLLVGRRRRAV